MLQSLLSKDQLRTEKAKSNYLLMYEEADITFLPTYKYDPHTDDFDSSKKQRVPAWCDRILYHSAKNSVKCLHYDKIDRRDSDHRPVKALFSLEVACIDEGKMKQTRTQFHREKVD